MIQVKVAPVPEAYHYDIRHLIKLYVDEVEFLFVDQPYTDPIIEQRGGIHPDRDHRETIESGDREERGYSDRWNLSFSYVREGDQVHVTAHLTNREGREALGEAARLRKDEKRATEFALLEALTAFTGVHQPWGILIGVRPIKLYHKMKELGMDKVSIRTKLIGEYGLTPHKVGVMERIAERQLQVLPDLYRLQKEVSLYIGIPFCPTKCAYCTFPAYALQGKQGSVEAFLEALLKEIGFTGEWLRRRHLPVTTLYIGGGTPTSLTAGQLDLLLRHLSSSIPAWEDLRELTVEAGRPDTITPEKIDVMKRWRVDRISINPQSFTQATLRAIGRHHTVEETIEAYRLARAMGMGNINMDLIIGLPGEGMEVFRKSLFHIEELMPDSLTVHTLSFKSASEMTQNREKYPVSSRDEVERMVRYAEDWTRAHGYHPYYLYRQKNMLGNQENVGYALPGKESLYNILIMEERETIIGLGSGASSKIYSPKSGKLIRFSNPKEPKVYEEHSLEYIERKLAILDEAYEGLEA